MCPEDHRKVSWGFYICYGRCMCTSKPFLFHVGLTSVVKLLAVVLTVVVSGKGTSALSQCCSAFTPVTCLSIS